MRITDTHLLVKSLLCLALALTLELYGQVEPGLKSCSVQACSSQATFELDTKCLLCAGLLQTSRVGAGHASEGYAANSRRTSSSMLADPLTLAGNPRLRSLCAALQERAWRLLSAGK